MRAVNPLNGDLGEMINRFTQTVLQSHDVDGRERLTPTAKKFQRTLKRVHRKLPGPMPPRYNVTISHSHSFVWYRVAKVGTRTTLTSLRESEATLDLEHASNLILPTWLTPGYTRVAFVRHPIERFVSAWQNRVIRSNAYGFDNEQRDNMRNISNFVGWFADQDPATCDRHLRLQSALIPADDLDLLGRMETFEDDLDAMFDLLGLTRETHHHRNKSSQKKPELIAADRNLLAQIYRPDIERFGYAP